MLPYCIHRDMLEHKSNLTDSSTCYDPIYTCTEYWGEVIRGRE